MSSSIKPPTGSAPGLSSPSDVRGPSDIKSIESAESGAVRAPATQAGAPSTAQADGPNAALLRQLEAGQVTRQQAIEGLVQNALEAHGGGRLSPQQRGELEQVLRAALMDDPVLGRLIGED